MTSNSKSANGEELIMTQTIPITLIKLGGSVVTFKNQAYRPRLQVLRRLIREIKQA
ncbi:hypothetical protein KKF92_04340 [Patescibacteria group bacterium]|nr:hypothetical protein [Patescibacteria group bacterium]